MKKYQIGDVVYLVRFSAVQQNWYTEELIPYQQ